MDKATMPTAKPSAYVVMPRGTYADGLAVGIVFLFYIIFLMFSYSYIFILFYFI